MLGSLERYKGYAPLLVRVGLGLVFLFFGVDKIQRPEVWVGWIPPFLRGIDNFLLINGIIEIAFGVLLIIGLFTRYVALIVSVFLMGILVVFSIDNITGRDIGLLFSAVSLILTGPGSPSIDEKNH